jgi:hypothetical protein
MGICVSPQGCLMDTLDTVWGGLADGIRAAAGEAITTLFGWWTTPSSTTVNSAVVQAAQRYTITWIAIPIAVLAVLAAVTWGAASPQGTWLRDVARGLLVFGVTAAGSIPIVAALQAWFEALASGLLGAVPTGDVGKRLIDLLSLPGVGPAQVTFWGALLFLVSLVQYLVMLFRDGAVLVLTAVLPVAAAGQFTRGSILWLPKVAGWLIAFLAFKPAAALVYYIGLSLLGQGNDVHALASGACVMVAAVLALPALLRLVTFAVTSPHLGSGGLSTVATLSGIAASAAQLATRTGVATGTTTAAQPQGAASSAASTSFPATAAIGALTNPASTTSSATGSALDPNGGSR